MKRAREESSEIDESQKRLALTLKSFSEHFNVKNTRTILHDDNVDTSCCNVCRRPLSYEGNVIHDGQLVHSGCFGKQQVPSTKPSIEKAPIQRLLTQPAKFQIANYNIHPAPSIAFSRPFADSVNVTANLFDCSSKTVINGGFQSGETRTLRAGQSTLYFIGLKLNKMAPIKTELNMRNSKQMNSDFCVLFKIDGQELYSGTFRLVSSCSQLPPDIREQVRPKKPLKIDFQEVDELNFIAPISELLQANGNWKSLLLTEESLSEEAKKARLDLESAIEEADADLAAKAAQKLAFLKKSNSNVEMRVCKTV